MTDIKNFSTKYGGYTSLYCLSGLLLAGGLKQEQLASSHLHQAWLMPTLQNLSEKVLKLRQIILQKSVKN